MIYKLKSKKPSAPHVIYTDTIKASCTLFIEFLKVNEIFDDYVNNLIDQQKIDSPHDVERFVERNMRERGASDIVNASFNWARCTFPKRSSNIGSFWLNTHEEFVQLHDLFKEEVLNVR